MAHCVLLTEPIGTGDEADHRAQRITTFGAALSLESLGIELDTSEFGTYKGVKPGSVTKSISSSTLPSNSGSRSL
ncbi:hypothetical protein M2271_005525 [Streptomyces sp. LBL]|nr:hypothetical protein [Streptomyces sp. LBL]